MARSLGHRLVIVRNENDLEEIFDADFTENEEYYREDTLRLGYRNEAARVIQENKNDNGGSIDYGQLIEDAFSDSYYTDIKYKVEHVNDVDIISIAYMSQ